MIIASEADYLVAERRFVMRAVPGVGEIPAATPAPSPAFYKVAQAIEVLNAFAWVDDITDPLGAAGGATTFSIRQRTVASSGIQVTWLSTGIATWNVPSSTIGGGMSATSSIGFQYSDRCILIPEGSISGKTGGSNLFFEADAGSITGTFTLRLWYRPILLASMGDLP